MRIPALIVFALLLAAPASGGSERATAAQIIDDHDFPMGLSESDYLPIMDRLVARALDYSDFASLDAMASRYRTTKARTPTGGWVLSRFYQSFINLSSEPENAAPMLKTIERWAAKFPNSPTARVAYATVLTQKAWAGKGDGFPNSVPRQTWLQADADFAAAVQYLELHEATAAQDPHYYVALLNAGIGAQWPASKYNAVINEALAKRPDYGQIYDSASAFFMPDNKGSFEALDAFAVRAANAARPYYGNEEYARLYRNVVCERCYANIFKSTKAQYPRVLAGYREMLHAWPDPTIPSQLFYFACQAGDAVTASEMLERISDRHRSSLWPQDGVEYQICVHWAQGHV